MLQMAQHNIGSLVVLKPGEQQHIAGIFTERGKTLSFVHIILHGQIFILLVPLDTLTNMN